ncbi:MAG: hypothetical protein ABI367_14485 [Mucilaginibacter sp.]
MKREEIEQLLADYANGEISPENRQRLEKIFEQDANLKQEAEEMAVVWQELNGTEEPSAAMDKQFYAMLQNERVDERSKGARVVQINASWIKAAAAIAACIIMFVVGRFTASPPEVIKYKYKTVLVKQPAINTPQLKPEPVLAVRHPVNSAIKPEKEIIINDNNTKMAQQLRSVYVSERIDAVMKLSAQKNLSDGDLKLLELALQEDPNANVRLTVINSLRPLISLQNVQQVLISGLNSQDNLLVQNSLVDLLVSAKSKLAIPQLITLLENKNTDAIVQNKIKGSIESFLN